MKRPFFLTACLATLAACGGSQPTFTELQNDALALYDARTAEIATDPSDVVVLRGSALYDGVAYFEASGASVPTPIQVRGEMIVNVDFGLHDPSLTGQINKMVSYDEEALSGSLTFSADAEHRVYNDYSGEPPVSYIGFDAALSGSMTVPGGTGSENVDAQISGAFFGNDAELIAGGIRDYSGPLMINGGFVVRDN